MLLFLCIHLQRAKGTLSIVMLISFPDLLWCYLSRGFRMWELFVVNWKLKFGAESFCNCAFSRFSASTDLWQDFNKYWMIACYWNQPLSAVPWTIFDGTLSERVSASPSTPQSGLSASAASHLDHLDLQLPCASHRQSCRWCCPAALCQQAPCGQAGVNYRRVITIWRQTNHAVSVFTFSKQPNKRIKEQRAWPCPPWCASPPPPGRHSLRALTRVRSWLCWSSACSWSSASAPLSAALCQDFH